MVGTVLLELLVVRDTVGSNFSVIRDSACDATGSAVVQPVRLSIANKRNGVPNQCYKVLSDGSILKLVKLPR